MARKTALFKLLLITSILMSITITSYSKTWQEDTSLVVYRGCLTTKERRDLVEYALRAKGHPYIWGGSSLLSGTDCSGLCYLVYKHFGYDIPRTASAQSKALQSVAIEDLSLGDLVYYTDGSRVYHIAMYIGNGEILQAHSTARGIVVTSVFYSTDVGGAVTVLGVDL